MRYVIWGCGTHVKKIVAQKKIDIDKVLFVDRVATNILGHEVLKPEDVRWEEEDIIVIGSPIYCDDIKKDALMLNPSYVGPYIYIDELVNENAPNISTNDDYIQIKEQKEWGGSIKQSLLDEAKILCDRSEALKRLPKGMICGEVGVASGNFSQKILDNMSPKIFHAIDLFSETVPYFALERESSFDSNMETHLEFYSRRFKPYIDEGIVITHKGMSWDVLDTFPDDYFDYIYLDAAHDFNSVKKDIFVLTKKVRKNGYIQFNDYSWLSLASKDYFGVVPCVNHLINDSASKVLFFCMSSDGMYDIVIQLNK